MASSPHILPMHRLWRLLPTQTRRRLLWQSAALLAPRPDRPPPAATEGLAVGGEIGRASGLGEGARLMLAALAWLNLPHVGFAAGLTIPGENTDQPAFTLPPPGMPLVLHINAPFLPAALLRLPRRLLRGRLVIGYWAWELSKLPADWRLGTRFVHEIWTPSSFCADTMQNLAPGRVRVVPHAVATAAPPARLTRADFGLPATAILVLVSFSLASSFVRKNPLAAIAAFRQAFGTCPERQLLLKIAHAGHAPADMAQLRAAAGDAPNIRFETRILPDADNRALIACADIVLSLHRSEGFGLVPAEAMLLGRPVVATDWSGTTDFLTPDTGIPIPYKLVEAADPRGVYNLPGAQWAEANIGAAAAALARLADNPTLRAQLGASAQSLAKKRFGPEPLAAELRRIGAL